MIRKSTLAVAIIAGSIIGSNMMTTTPASAATYYFKAFNGSTPWTGSWLTIGDGFHRRKMSTAYKRANRRCKRRLKRAQRKNQIPRGTRTPECYERHKSVK